MSASVAWDEFAAAEPEMAETGTRMLYRYGPGLGFLATVRGDGGPRVHPVCPAVVGGRLWVFVLDGSPKRADLDRDGRYALHSFPDPERDDELYVTGRATRVEHDELRTMVRGHQSGLGVVEGGNHEILYELGLERVLLARYGARPSWPPEYRRWRAPAVR
jgi:hypothetical protein